MLGVREGGAAALRGKGEEVWGELGGGGPGDGRKSWNVNKLIIKTFREKLLTSGLF